MRSCWRRIRCSSRGRRSCSSRARRAACSRRAPSKLRRGVDDQQALLIGIKCERGSHKFFKRYGERFEDSEGKQIFLEFAAEERAHLDLADRRVPRASRAPRRQAQGAAEPKLARSDQGKNLTAASRRNLTGKSRVPRDRPSHPHDRLRRALHAGGAGGRAPRARASTVLGLTDHDTVGRRRAATAAACARAGIEFVPGDRDHGDRRRHRRPRARLLHRRRVDVARDVPCRAAPAPPRPGAA